MLLGKVVGTLVSTRKEESMTGLKFLVLKEINVESQETGRYVIAADVVSLENRYHHDAKKLADALTRLYYQRPETEILAEEVPAQSAIVM